MRRRLSFLFAALLVAITIAWAAASTATTQAASALTTSTALLNGTGNPGGESATGWFRVATSDPGICTDSFGSRVPNVGGTNLGTGTSAVAYSITANGLTSGTTYWFCAIVSNASGTSYGSVLSFTVPGPPAMVTLPADTITSSNAVLRATGNPLGTTSTGWFRYSATDPGTCSDAFGTRLPTSGGASLGAGTAPFAFSQTPSGLSPGTTYYYCAIGSNSFGTSLGTVASFTTAANAPGVTTSTPSPISGSGATLRGSINPGGAATTAWFRYGTISPGTCNDSFGTRMPAVGGVAVAPGATTAVTQDVTGLTPGGTYYVCAIAQNSVGTGVGSVVTITTPLPPTAATVSAYAITNTSVTIEGAGVPNRATTTGWFRLGSTNPVTCNDTFGSRFPVTGGTSLAAGTSSVTFTESVSGLTAGATYYYCAITSSAEGTAFGVVQSVTMAAAPSVTTAAASAVDASSAVLNASGDPNGATGTGWFRYFTSDPGTCSDSGGTRAPSSGGSSFLAVYDPVAYNRSVTGLLPGVTYWYCPIVSNSYGTAFGTVSSFTTAATAPTVSTSSVTTFTGTTATLRGSGTPNGAATTAWLRYSTVSPGTCNDTFGTRAPLSGGTSLGSGNSSVAFTEAVTGLSPGTTYYACAIAQNSVGTTVGSVASFTTAEAPTATTQAANSILDTSATLNGSGTPNRATATGWFRYSATNPGVCSDTFGSRAPTTSGTSLGSGTTDQAFSQSISGLSAGVTYYFCAITQSSEGTALGAVLSFTTLSAPTASTQAASSVSSTAATLNGTGDPNGASGTGWFRYATTDPGICNDSFGTRAPTSSGSALGAVYDPVRYTRALSGLLPGTTYYTCAIVSNSYGTAFGNIVSFTTPPAAPTVTTSSANNIVGTGASLRGSADPTGAATTGWFRYDTISPGTCNDTFGTRSPLVGGTDLGAANGSVSYTQNITGLSPGVTYYACAIAENSVAKSWGAVVSFTTPIPPDVTTSAATSVANTGGTLNGAATPNRAATTGWFRYSATNPVTCNDTFGSRAPITGGTSLGSGTTSTTFSESITGLTAGATYYFCAIASSTEGTRFGTVQSFTTVDVPRMTTDATSLITSTTAQLNGRGDPNGATTTGWFRYATTHPGACSDSFGTRAPTSSGTNLGATDGDVAYNRSITGLVANTTYYACAIGSNAYGTSLGSVITFTTLPPPASLPTITTSSATNVTSATATLRGNGTPNNADTTGWLRYSTSNPVDCNDTFGIRVPTTGGTALGSGTASVAFTQDITGLVPGTTYYVCAIGQNSVGTAWGGVASFVTPLPPLVTTGATSSITNGAATLNATGTPNRAATTGWFRYSSTDPGACSDTFGARLPSTGGTSLGSGTVAVDFAQSIPGGLAPDTTYYYCALASSAEGTSTGAVLSFRTHATPVVTTLAATGITATSATFPGSGIPKGASTTAWFRYSATNPGTCSDSFGTRAPTSGGSGLGAVYTDVAYSQTVSSLTPATQYWYCAHASNVYGATTGTLLTFTTPPTAPTVTTSSANNILGTSAGLRGSVNPGGGPSTGWFRYSTISPGTCNDTFGTRAPGVDGTPIPAGNSSVAYTETITGLVPGATYYYCAIAQNSVDKAWGGVASFVTPLPPDVTTLAATDLTNSSATLQATANPNRATTSGWFRYAATNPGACNDTFGSRAPATGTVNLGSGTTTQPMSQSISGLSAGVAYYYCAIAQSSEGTDFGEVLTLTTLDAPIVQTTAAIAVTASAATLTASVNPNGASTTGWFRYSSTNPGSCNDSFGTRGPTSGGSSVGSGVANTTFERTVSGLLPGTTYWFCALASSAYGSSFGNLLSFTTPATAPLVTTNGASNIVSTSADINGTANPNGAPTTGWFRYDTTSPGTCNDTFGTRFPAAGGDPLGGGNTSITFNESLTGLLPGATYYVCAIAQNGIGVTVGSVVSFTTRRLPTVTTLAATPVTATTAQLNGSVNPNGSSTTGWFRYASTDPGVCNDTFGTRLPTTSGTNLGSGSAEVTYNYSVTDLLPGVTYYGCAIANSSLGTSFGAVLSFTTPATSPLVTTLAATGVGGTVATLQGSATPRGGATTAWFRYATTNPVTCNDGFGTRAPGSGGADLGSGNTAVPFELAVTGLQRGVTYYYCAIAENRAGVSLGNIVSFTTTAGCVGDADADGVCDNDDLCLGNDATGDADADGICGDLDPCLGNNGTGDNDADGTCNNLDLCYGDDATGDDDADGICGDRDICLGTDAAGDLDLDGICDNDDLCFGDDTAGDTDVDGVCDDLDVCAGDDATGDLDLDGVCEDLDVCEGDDTTGDTDRDGLCNNLDFSVLPGTLSAGQPFTINVRNAPAGRTVHFFVSTGPPPAGGNGPCAPSAPSVCVGISSPMMLGSRVANANGQASLTVTPPATLTPGLTVRVQAVWLDGASGDVTWVRTVTAQ